jgi:hypothetical protein
MPKHETNILTAVITRRKLLAVHTGCFVMFYVTCVVKYAVDARLKYDLTRLKLIACFGARHIPEPFALRHKLYPVALRLRH